MRRFLHRRHLGFVGALIGGAFICIAGVAPQAWAQDEQLATSGPSGRSILIREHAGWNRDCDAIAHPALYLDEPPRHGTVCARESDITIRSMYLGTEKQCIGRLVRGVRLVYRPDPGYAGSDRLRYAAQYPSARRTVSVAVTVAGPSSSAITGSVPSSLSASALRQHQPAGPVPVCADLMY